MPLSSYVLTSDHLQDTPLLFPQPWHLWSSLQSFDFSCDQSTCCRTLLWEKMTISTKRQDPQNQSFRMTIILPSFRCKIKPIGVGYPGKHVKHIFSLQINLHEVIHKQRTNSIENIYAVPFRFTASDTHNCCCCQEVLWMSVSIQHKRTCPQYLII